MSVTLDVFHPDTSRVVRDEHWSNIQLMFVTLDVFHPDNSRVVSFGQYLNILFISVTFDVSNLSRSASVHLVQLKNQNAVETGTITSLTVTFLICSLLEAHGGNCVDVYLDFSNPAYVPITSRSLSVCAPI